MNMSASRLISLLLLGSLLMNAAPSQGQEARASPAATAPVKLSGIVTAKDGKYFLTDSTTNSTVELRGGDLKRFVGKQVTITGELTPAGPAAAGAGVVTVGSIERTNGPNLAHGRAVPAAGAGGHTAAILGAVGLAVGGAVGGLYSAGVVGEQSASRQ
jgi:hypothetical protein